MCGCITACDHPLPLFDALSLHQQGMPLTRIVFHLFHVIALTLIKCTNMSNHLSLPNRAIHIHQHLLQPTRYNLPSSTYHLMHSNAFISNQYQAQTNTKSFDYQQAHTNNKSSVYTNIPFNLQGSAKYLNARLDLEFARVNSVHQKIGWNHLENTKTKTQ